MKYPSFGLVLLMAMVTLALGAEIPPASDGHFHGDPPYLLEEGWKPLLNGKNLNGWRFSSGAKDDWQTIRGVFWGGPDNPRELTGRPAPGDRLLFMGRPGKTGFSNLFTNEKFGDLELYLEFMIPENAAAGIFLQGLYGIQIRDSYGDYEAPVSELSGALMEYETTRLGGIAPREQAEEPAGKWQSLHIWFQAPRFNAQDQKTSNAKFVRVLYNGTLIHENIEREGRSVGALDLPEAAENPLLLQGGQSPIAFRNIYVRPLKEIPVFASQPMPELKVIRTPDVIFVPTPQEVVEKMLELAQVQKDDVVYDLGCGDGRIVVTAAKKYGCRGFGFDIDPERIMDSLENVKKNKVEHLVTIEQQDIFTLDLTPASVITLYLLPSLNVKLIPQLEKLKPGTRIVSHDFDMKGVKPDQVVEVDLENNGGSHTIYLWTTPLKKEKEN